VRPGHAVAVVDLSPSGALIEGGRPLRPGARVQVQLDAGGARAALSARVVRCLVAAIDADRGVTYRAALAFDERCALIGEQPAPPGYAIPDESGKK
jgi:hypothetical protein